MFTFKHFFLLKFHCLTYSALNQAPAIFKPIFWHSLSTKRISLTYKCLDLSIKPIQRHNLTSPGSALSQLVVRLIQDTGY